MSVEVFSRPSPVRNRINEDSWLFIDSPKSPGLVSFAVIDGAGTRKRLPVIEERIRERFPNLTPAAFATHIVKSSLEQQLMANPECSLRGALLQSNNMLRNELVKILDTFEPEQIVEKFDLPFVDDLRKIRLVLPTCVVTVARLDLTELRLEYAHLGDTGLFEIHREDLVRHTRDQMRRFDVEALGSVLDLQQRKQIEHFDHAVSSPEGREYIIQSGLRLNYVNSDEITDPQQGCGVINGLPEMEDYLETGSIDVDIEKTLGFFILSDGLELLSPLDESAMQQYWRYQKMAQLVRDSGLRGLYNEMTQMSMSDIHLDMYPRTKLQDDATGVYLGLGRFNN